MTSAAKKFFALVTLLCAASGAFSQMRGAIRVFIPPVAGGTPEQKAFFEEQFKMEIQTAGYSIADSSTKSDFSIRIIVQPNPLYNARAGEKQFDLIIVLLQSIDNAELVRFSFPFDQLQEMYDWNMFLVYQAMANVPAEAQEEAVKRVYGTPPTDGSAPVSDSWRNKWLYFSFALGGDMIYFLNHGTLTTAQGMVMPSAMLGIEVRLLDFFSYEGEAKLRVLHDGENYILTAAFPILLKGVIKPSDYLMIQPYLGLEYSLLLATEAQNAQIPWFAAVAGGQLAFRRGARDAFFVDISVNYSILGEFKLITESTHGTLIFGLQLGWKIGIFDRPK